MLSVIILADKSINPFYGQYLRIIIILLIDQI
ncbi:Uncharacterised protein [Yersinia kristensenii]|uniref:Uncharacterized protein n=1 Tax=Yersinia kristensenii TaxID=28152 RepID=A0A0T9L6V5_YERKR|nr:Uncharacterised protein [Yersinia kristensenii]